jgi:hypothetical protein
MCHNVEEKKMHTKFYEGNLKQTEYMLHLGVNGRIIKMDLKRNMLGVGLD